MKKSELKTSIKELILEAKKEIQLAEEAEFQLPNTTYWKKQTELLDRINGDFKLASLANKTEYEPITADTLAEQIKWLWENKVSAKEDIKKYVLSKGNIGHMDKVAWHCKFPKTVSKDTNYDPYKRSRKWTNARNARKRATGGYHGE
jgi:hypothetical protein